MNKQIEIYSYKWPIAQKQKDTNYWYSQGHRWAQEHEWKKPETKEYQLYDSTLAGLGISTIYLN